MLEFCLNHIANESFPSYDLSYETACDMIFDLSRQYKKAISSDIKFLTIEVEGTSEYSNIGRCIERIVFEESFGNNAEVMSKEYSAYEQNSIFFITLDRMSRQPIAVMRIISNSPNGIKTLIDMQKEPFNISLDETMITYGLEDLSNVWDIGTIAVLPQYRGLHSGLISLQLYRALYLSSLRNNIEHWVSIIDFGLYKMLTGLFAMPFVPIMDSKPGSYLGSKKSYVVYTKVSVLFDTVKKHIENVKNEYFGKILTRLVNGEDDDCIILAKYNDGKNINI